MFVLASNVRRRGEKKKSCCYGMIQCELFCPSLWAKSWSLHMWSLHVVTYSGCSWKHALAACILALLLEAIRSSSRSRNDVMTDAIIECPPPYTTFAVRCLQNTTQNTSNKPHLFLLGPFMFHCLYICVIIVVGALSLISIVSIMIPFYLIFYSILGWLMSWNKNWNHRDDYLQHRS